MLFISQDSSIGSPSGSMPRPSLAAGTQLGLQFSIPVASMILLMSPFWVSVIESVSSSLTNLMRGILQTSTCHLKSLCLQVVQKLVNIIRVFDSEPRIIDIKNDEEAFLVKEAFIILTLLESFIEQGLRESLIPQLGRNGEAIQRLLEFQASVGATTQLESSW
jgi:hypothetical protein